MVSRDRQEKPAGQSCSVTAPFARWQLARPAGSCWTDKAHFPLLPFKTRDRKLVLLMLICLGEGCCLGSKDLFDRERKRTEVSEATQAWGEGGGGVFPWPVAGNPLPTPSFVQNLPGTYCALGAGQALTEQQHAGKRLASLWIPAPCSLLPWPGMATALAMLSLP